MRSITILAYFPENESSKGFLINEEYAILADLGAAFLTKIVPTANPDVYTAKEYIHVASVEIGDRSEMEEIIKMLHETSAFILLTEHLHPNEETYYINQKF